MKRFLPATAALLTMALCSASGYAAEYTFRDYTLSIPGANDVFLTGLNDTGKVVGVYGTELTPLIALEPTWKGFVADIDGGNVVTLNPDPAATAVEASSVNDGGVVAGNFSIFDPTVSFFEVVRGFVYDGQSYTEIRVPFDGAIDTVVTSIDDGGIVRGSWSTVAFIGDGVAPVSSGFRAVPNGVGGYFYGDVDLAPSDPEPGVSYSTFLSGANAVGQEIATRLETFVSGLSITQGEKLGYLLPDTAFKHPTDGAVTLGSINDDGTIVGTVSYSVGTEEDRRFFEEGFAIDANELAAGGAPSFTKIDIPNDDFAFTEETSQLDQGHRALTGINNDGTIIGFYDNNDTVYRGFIGTPVTSGIEGDFNGDGRVNNGDLGLLLGSWGSETVPPAWVNGFVAPVNNGELGALLSGWGAGVVSSESVPEPFSAVLAAGCLVWVACRR